MCGSERSTDRLLEAHSAPKHSRPTIFWGKVADTRLSGSPVIPSPYPEPEERGARGARVGETCIRVKTNAGDGAKLWVFLGSDTP